MFRLHTVRVFGHALGGTDGGCAGIWALLDICLSISSFVLRLSPHHDSHRELIGWEFPSGSVVWTEPNIVNASILIACSLPYSVPYCKYRNHKLCKITMMQHFLTQTRQNHWIKTKETLQRLQRRHHWYKYLIAFGNFQLLQRYQRYHYRWLYLNFWLQYSHVLFSLGETTWIGLHRISWLWCL